MTGRPSIISGVLVPLLLFASSAVVRSQGVTVHVRGTYTTTARLYPNPTSPSPFIREEYQSLEDITGLGVEVRYPLEGDEFGVGVSVGYLSFVDRSTKPIALGGALRSLPVADGFSLIPIELSGIVEIPLESESYRMSMSGGIGMYLAQRILEVAEARVDQRGTSVGYGIHVAVTFGYRFLPGLWLQFASTFRDPDVTMEYSYDRDQIIVNGTVLPLPSSPMHTRVNVDGMTLSLGLMVDVAPLFAQ